jgi:4,5-epoxidase
VRDHVFLPIMRWPPMQRWWVDTGSQLRVSYRGGPLADTLIGSRISAFIRRSPMPGDRGPDASCRVWATGESTTLGDQVDAQWALLLIGGPEAEQRVCAEAARSCRDRHLRVVRILPAGQQPRDGDDTQWADAGVQDDRGTLARAYRPGRHAVVLLRPDGHVAWRSSKLLPAGLISWLGRALDGQAALPTIEAATGKRRESTTA